MHGQETDKTDKTPAEQVLSVLSVSLPMLPGKLETYMTDAELRQVWRQWCDHGGGFPPECRDMTCGAQTRAGTPCRRRDLYRSGRCKLHGGLSSGPKTAKGKRRSARNGKRTAMSKPHERIQKPNNLGKSGGAALA